jgi:DNA-binding protein Fis
MILNRSWSRRLHKKGDARVPAVGTITLEEMEIEMIKKAMLYHKNKVSKAATALGLNPQRIVPQVR